MIRELNQHDLDDYLQIRMDSLKINPEAFGASYAEKPDRRQTLVNLKAKNDEDFILGWFEAGQLIGIIGFIRNIRQKIRHKATIWGMFVYPEYRGQGIGLQLLQNCIERGEQMLGLEKIDISVVSIQKRALKLYLSLGFDAYGEEKNAIKVIGRSYHLILMSRTCQS